MRRQPRKHHDGNRRQHGRPYDAEDSAVVNVSFLGSNKWKLIGTTVLHAVKIFLLDILVILAQSREQVTLRLWERVR